MRPLTWSRMQCGNWNGKVGPLTLFSIAWHTGKNVFIVISKLPGGKTQPVGCVEEGKRVAEKMWGRFLEVVNGLGMGN